MPRLIREIEIRRSQGTYGGRRKLLGLSGGEHFFDRLVERGITHTEVEVVDAELVEREKWTIGGAPKDCYSVT